ncbi:hypothetical protein L195_g049782 [Trifolium pratense]|uniref:Uncharacterized protein n=1 Tax=Trifolium pratense TaxID=57577 RepID=A0A2K3JQF1_TRIPR|nr:hypothetical protein L195_g049782 [Trifolium pratense]
MWRGITLIVEEKDCCQLALASISVSSYIKASFGIKVLFDRDPSYLNPIATVTVSDFTIRFI